MASQGLTRTLGSAVDRAGARLQFAHEAIVEAGEMRLAPFLQGRFAARPQTAIDSRERADARSG